MKPAKFCEDCSRWRYSPPSAFGCSIGHKPRFYANDRGGEWKRRCDDFRLSKRVVVIPRSAWGPNYGEATP